MMSDTKKIWPADLTQDDLGILQRHMAAQNLLRLRSEIRALIDDDPIDLPVLEATLRKALGSLPGAMEFTGSKKICDGLKAYERYCKDLLVVIVGRQH
jgi:hypothetical protein